MVINSPPLHSAEPSIHWNHSQIEAALSVHKGLMRNLV